MMQKIATTDVFTPTTPAISAFVEREAINLQLVDGLRTPGKQVVVYGPSGSGKTTLLVNKLHQLYPDHITSRCTAATTFESLLLGAFDSLDVYYSTGTSIKRAKTTTYKLEQSYFTIKGSIEAASSVPPQLTPQRLAEFCGAAECCWVLEDFHKVPISEKEKLSQIMKVFTDTAAEYPGVKIVAIGAVDTARDVIRYDPEMRNRVAEIAVPLMTETELVSILDKGSHLLNVDFGDLKQQVASYASGLAAVCHQLCLNICFAAEIYETREEMVTISGAQLQSAIERYISDASDTLKAVFDLATRQQRRRRFDNTKLILKALTKLESKGGSHAAILVQIRLEEPQYPASNLTTYLGELQRSERGGVLRFDSFSGKYYFSDPLYLAYSQCLLNPAEIKPSAQGIGWINDIKFEQYIQNVMVSQNIYIQSVHQPMIHYGAELNFGPIILEPKVHKK
jgi:hypothetical protein